MSRAYAKYNILKILIYLILADIINITKYATLDNIIANILFNHVFRVKNQMNS